ncbi:hypothetical protein [Poseidonibacter ostreae]|uniref:Uncharacterized protein n=1 Tax=Poseidonibacter ostreae TaxID=2654171 RepID=A0A6L4WXS2_9BACT|nr:hypothetical protein [Poseidonibacter ostreae]KAB7891250.1 hypothetical protein GBG19_00005 [Poseidonibacter ostreae]
MKKKNSTKLILLLAPLFLMANATNTDNMLHYEKVDRANMKKSQAQINATYLYGIKLMKNALVTLKKENKLNKSQLKEECNPSLYTAIFGETIVDDLSQKNSEKQFLRDCRKYIKKIK